MDDVIRGPGELFPATTVVTVGADVRATPAYQAYRLLHIAFIVLPLVAGVDKFFDALMHWDVYLAPQIARLSPWHAHGFMLAVGVVEIIASAIVALKPRVGAYVVAGWLACIMFNLLLNAAFYDIMLRDLGLCLGALALGRLARIYDRPLLARRRAAVADRALVSE